MPIALIDEVIHLFCDDVSGLANSMKNADVFEKWRDDLAIPSRGHGFGKRSHEAPPTGGFGRKDVTHPWAGLELGHKYSG
ncbi:unannotated protein [freshwater metagenome]|uniref:Unannotated protein n=1 Tax=freshwater metagenome TaxID=449393 RepID=A0A6J6Y4B6_9ZZZZ